MQLIGLIKCSEKHQVLVGLHLWGSPLDHQHNPVAKKAQNPLNVFCKLRRAPPILCSFYQGTIESVAALLCGMEAACLFTSLTPCHSTALSVL